MNNNIAIEFEHVSKLYRLGVVGTGTLSQDIHRWWVRDVLKKGDPYLKIGQTNDRSTKGDSDIVYALQDIDFKVEQGDVVGIIGRNGAGKSTLLKLLSRITAPTAGRIRVKGRIASLLEVGTGFHSELTGRENIYMNGSIMGMTKHEIDRKIDEIIAFAGIERYIDTPVKRYSSGMTVRLGFSVAAHLEPDILVVDEVLAVGDAEFQKKAIGKMRDISHGGGRTVLFVSHNMAAVRGLCKNGVVLQNGQVEFIGTADAAVDFYLDNKIDNTDRTVVLNEKHHDSEELRQLEIIEASILNEDYLHMATDEPIRLYLKIKINELKEKKFTLGISIVDNTDKRVGTYVSPIMDVPSLNDYFDVDVEIKHHNLARGKYTLDFNVGLKDLAYGLRDFDVTRGVLSFEIVYQTGKKVISLWYPAWGNINYRDVTISCK